MGVLTCDGDDPSACIPRSLYAVRVSSVCRPCLERVVSSDSLLQGSRIAARLLNSTTTPLRRVQLLSRSPDAEHAALADSLLSPHNRRLEPPVNADITDPDSLAPGMRDADVVVSLVGIMHGTPAEFERVQWKGAENVAKAAQAVGAKLIHVSAIGANAESSIPYARTKALGEQAVLAACPNATIVRPSILFGPGDGFFTVSYDNEIHCGVYLV